MADFELAYGETESHEGGYVNDPDDRGGETHRGVSRRYHPDWPGWPLIDRIKEQYPQDFARRINQDSKLVTLSKRLYRDRYWQPILGDQISNQHLANKLFDTAVHQGVSRSVQFLQESLNLLNRNQADYRDVVLDGRMGPVTLAAMGQLLNLEKSQPDYLLKLLNLMQGAGYLELLRKDASQEKYVRGWLNRVDLR